MAAVNHGQLQFCVTVGKMLLDFLNADILVKDCKEMLNCPCSLIFKVFFGEQLVNLSFQLRVFPQYISGFLETGKAAVTDHHYIQPFLFCDCHVSD